MMVLAASGVANRRRRNQSRAMKRSAVLLIGLLLGCAAPGMAAASSSRWAGVEGGAVRLVISGAPEAGGTLRGALQIDLKPGWKTYWLDPGDTGVPPRISVTGASLARVAYPVPRRFDEAGTVWNGYEAPVSFAVALKVADSRTKEIEADVFLGICQSICIPLQAHLTLDPAADPQNADDAAVVARAFEAVPASARPGFRLGHAKRDGSGTLRVEAELPRPGTDAELFLAAPEGYSFGPPKQSGRTDGKAVFSVPVYDRPQGAAPRPEAAYTLVQDGDAVEGTVLLP
jgi:DsbC/DsbD-like thiol-disulfide interchange protein